MSCCRPARPWGPTRQDRPSGATRPARKALDTTAQIDPTLSARASVRVSGGDRAEVAVARGRLRIQVPGAEPQELRAGDGARLVRGKPPERVPRKADVVGGPGARTLASTTVTLAPAGWGIATAAWARRTWWE
jgi:hypothetical protein